MGGYLGMRIGQQIVGLKEGATAFDLFGGAEQPIDGVEHRTTDVGHPQRRKAEFLQFRGGLGHLVRIAVAQLGTPHAHTGNVHGGDSNPDLGGNCGPAPP